jgi:hypothetical protein
MKKLLLVLMTFVPIAQADEVDCPKFYPSEDTVLTEVPYRHNGKGIVAKQELSGASAMGSPYNFKPPMEFHGGHVNKVKGGTDIEMPLDTRWFVCYYGKGTTVAWWEELKHDPDKIKNCTIKIRDKVGRDPMDIKFVCK